MELNIIEHILGPYPGPISQASEGFTVFWQRDSVEAAADSLASYFTLGTNNVGYEVTVKFFSFHSVLGISVQLSSRAWAALLKLTKWSERQNSLHCCDKSVLFLSVLPEMTWVVSPAQYSILEPCSFAVAGTVCSYSCLLWLFKTINRDAANYDALNVGMFWFWEKRLCGKIIG